MVRFRPNKCQKYLLKKIKRIWEEGKPIRLLILKARQLGSSTLIEALIFAVTSQVPNQNSTIIADDLKGSNYILEMSKLYQEKCPGHLRRSIKKSNEKKLEWADTHSQIIIDTAENPDAGRKFTFRLAHLSECAFYKKYETLMLGLSQSVPSLPQTMIIQETTANGFNHFKDVWDDAVEGRTDYVPVFLPWYWDDGYKMPVDENFVVGDVSPGEITKDELRLKGLMQNEGITEIPERLQWRRWCIRNNCQGKVSNFRQEMPSNPEEAFIASGDCYFDKEKLAAQMLEAKKNGYMFRANIVKLDGGNKFELRKDKDGDFKFYEHPGPDGKYHGQYDIGGDACSGSGDDFAALEAGDKETNNTVATFHGKIEPHELAYKAFLLGSFLNNAMVGIENDKFGFAANNKLKSMYGRIYVQRQINKKTDKVKEIVGWSTNSLTRPKMLAQMEEDIREDATQLRDERLVKECLTFIKNPESGKVEAQSGCHDDFVIARAIRGVLRQEKPFTIPSTRKPGKPVKNREKNARFKFARRP